MNIRSTFPKLILTFTFSFLLIFLYNKRIQPLKLHLRFVRFFRLAVILFVGLLPFFILGIFSYLRLDHSLTQNTLYRRQSMASLSATILKERLDRLHDIGTSLIHQEQLQQLVAEKKWDEAAAILQSVPVDFPFIDRLVLLIQREF